MNMKILDFISSKCWDLPLWWQWMVYFFGSNLLNRTVNIICFRDLFTIQTDLVLNSMSQQLKLTRGEDYQWISVFLTKPYFMTSQDFEYSTQTCYDNVMVFWVHYEASKLLFLFIVIALIKKRPAQSSVPQWLTATDLRLD